MRLFYCFCSFKSFQVLTGFTHPLLEDLLDLLDLLEDLLGLLGTHRLARLARNPSTCSTCSEPIDLLGKHRLTRSPSTCSTCSTCSEPIDLLGSEKKRKLSQISPWVHGSTAYVKKKYLSEIIRNPRFLSIPWESWESLDFFKNEMTSQNPGKVWISLKMK
jgi:hypothetical protein